MYAGRKEMFQSEIQAQTQHSLNLQSSILNDIFFQKHCTTWQHNLQHGRHSLESPTLQ